jgi:hypothetical protein
MHSHCKQRTELERTDDAWSDEWLLSKVHMDVVVRVESDGREPGALRALDEPGGGYPLACTKEPMRQTSDELDAIPATTPPPSHTYS